MIIFPDEKPVRKPNRLQTHPYHKNGAYFITVVTKDRVEFLGRIAEGKMTLSPLGEMVAACTRQIEQIYPTVMLETYVVMPNHVHLLLWLMDEAHNPNLSRIVQQWKGAISKAAHFSFWQKDFYDNLILDSERFRLLKAYIESNLQRWEEDRYNENQG